MLRLDDVEVAEQDQRLVLGQGFLGSAAEVAGDLADLANPSLKPKPRFLSWLPTTAPSMIPATIGT